jgi:hypothetical protein
LKVIHKSAIDFTSSIALGHDSLTGEVLDNNLNLSPEHRFYFKYLSLYTIANGKLDSDQTAEILTAYKDILFEVYDFSKLEDVEVQAIAALYQNKMTIKDIAVATNTSPLLIEIVLFEQNLISQQKYRQWSESELETLKSQDWSNPNRSLFKKVAIELNRSVQSIISMAKKHGLYSTPGAETKIQANIANGQPRKAGLKWEDEDIEIFNNFDWSSVSVEKVKKVAETLERTFGSIVARASKFNLIDDVQKMSLMDVYRLSK